jgi:HNH endonuclease
MGTCVQAFRDAVRLRDQRCVITGEEVVTAHLDNWLGFEAAHIFPPAYERHWTDYNYGRWISIIPDTGGCINSVQNGLLLRSDIHQLFDSYDFSINPDVCTYILHFL